MSWECAFDFVAKKEYIGKIQEAISAIFGEALNMVEPNKNGSAHSTLQVLEVFPHRDNYELHDYELKMSIDFKKNWVYFESKGQQNQRSGARLDISANSSDPKSAAKNRVVIITSLLACIKKQMNNLSVLQYE